MKKVLALILLSAGAFFVTDAQTLGTGAVDTTKSKSVSVPAPKAELKAFDYNPNNGASQSPEKKKEVTQP